MNFKNALEYVYSHRTVDGELTDPFRLYCRLRDLCGASYCDREKVDAFYKLDKQYRIMQTLSDGGRQGVDKLRAKFRAGTNQISEDSFKSLISCVAGVLGITYMPRNVQPKTNTPKLKSVQPKPQTKKQNTGYIGEYILMIALIAAIVIVLAGVITGVVFLGIYAKSMTWVQWQWVIGSSGGLVVTALGIFVVWKFDDELICDYFVSGTILLVVLVVVNSVLLGLFQSLHKIISIWIYGYAIVVGTVLCFTTFYNCEEIWGFIQFGLILADIVALILSVILI